VSVHVVSVCAVFLIKKILQCIVVNGNAAYHLTHNVGKSWENLRKRCEHQNLTLMSTTS
jgi:hypothetical protein